MILNYTKLGFRNLWRSKFNSFINLIGLSLGLAACILIMMYVSHEKSYDHFHKDSDRIFNVIGKFQMGDQNIQMMRLSPIVSKQLKENDSNIEDAIRYYDSGVPISIKTDELNGEIFSEKSLVALDANLFSFFSFELLQGNPSELLEAPFSVVLSKTNALKFFGNNDPIGKRIQIKQDSTYNFTVTGVMKDMPSNSSVKGNLIISMSSLKAMKESKDIITSDRFQGGSFVTYLKLKDVNSLTQVEKTAVRLDRLSNAESNNTYALQPLTNMHSQNGDSGRFQYIDIFPLVALLILILALTNYISLTTARASTRAKEVGVRKISGASRKSIALQFYVESTLFVCISFVVGLLISVVLKDGFLELLNIKIDNTFFLYPSFLLTLGGLLFFTIIASSVYPAIVLSAFKPVENFKNKLRKNTGTVAVRKVFTTLQFTIAVLLIICGIVISVQLDFMSHKDLGLQRSNIVMIPVQKTMNTNASAFRNEVKRIAEVEQTTVTQYAMYGGYNIYYAYLQDSEENYMISTFNVDQYFIETLAVSWHLKPEDNLAYTKNKKIIINEKTIAGLGLKSDPRGEQIGFGNELFEVAGVVKDFNYDSLENPIKPLAFFVSSEVSANKNIIGSENGHLYVKYADYTVLPTLLNQIETLYKKFDEESTFTYEFMDDAFDSLYKSEARLSYMFYIFIALALVIAVLGLLGLVTFTSQQRVKEIGIRKVLGASISEILMLISKDFIKLVVLAIVIASPIAWYFADSWLSYFAYRITVPWWSFVVAGGIAILLSMLTLSVQGIKASIANPVDSLRSE